MYLFIIQTFVGMFHLNNLDKFIFPMEFLNSKQGNNLIADDECIELPKIILMKEMNNEVGEAFVDAIYHLEVEDKKCAVKFGLNQN